jgi:glycosyltransferase involved in cell wall biosynthesis
MPGIIKKFPDVKLLVIGEGNLKNEMLGLANKLDVSGNIIFTGSIPHNDLPPYFATADVFILPSLSEGFGLVVIEAISCKTLAITSNLEPIHDIINENETGFYLEGINEVAISEKIISVLQDKEKLEIMKEKGRRHVIKNFEWNIVSNNYARLLYRLF